MPGDRWRIVCSLYSCYYDCSVGAVDVGGELAARLHVYHAGKGAYTAYAGKWEGCFGFQSHGGECSVDVLLFCVHWFMFFLFCGSPRLIRCAASRLFSGTIIIFVIGKLK